MRALVPYALGDLVIKAAERSALAVPAPAHPTHSYQLHAGLLVEGRA